MHFIVSYLCKIINFLPLIKMFVSSANFMNESNFVTEHKSFIYRRKRSGPNIEPCGTPQMTGSLLD